MADVTLAGAAVVGGLVGGGAGLVPGLHVNTLATLALAVGLANLVGPEAAIAFLLGALGAQTFTTIVPLVLLGVPEGEDAPALLPGQRLAARGDASGALRASVLGSVTGLTVGVVLAVPLAWWLVTEGASTSVSTATPWVALAALAVLVLSDPSGLLRAGVLVMLAGVLGHHALTLPARPLLAAPASMLLPLFLGLFALPALVDARRAGVMGDEGSGGRVRQRGRPLVGALLGASLGTLAGLFAGFTAGPATAVAMLLRRGTDEEALATTSAVNTCAACIATAVLHATARTRSGVHAAIGTLAPPGVGLDALLHALGWLGLGAAVGIGLVALIAHHRNALGRTLPSVAGLLVPLWLGLVVAFTGWPGLAVLVVGYALARTTHSWGARRSLLMAVLLVPALLRTI